MLASGMRRAPGVVILSIVAGACGVAQESPKNGSPAGLITTPAAYYSSPKAKYLGAKYKDHLDRLVERIIRNPKTANLQLANNIGSIGGIGFFTHSAAKLSDERFLEVIVTAPDAVDARDEHGAGVFRLFRTYGTELLSIMASESTLYEEKDVSGYGLNFTWRSAVSEPTGGRRVIVERAVLYLPKEEVRAFLGHRAGPDQLLKQAVIFTGQESGPMTLLSYRPQPAQPDSRPPIQDETLAETKSEPARQQSERPPQRQGLANGSEKPKVAAPVESKAAAAAAQAPSANEQAPSTPEAAQHKETARAPATAAVKTPPEPTRAPAGGSQPAPKAATTVTAPIKATSDGKPAAGQIAAVASKPAADGRSKNPETVSLPPSKPPAAETKTVASGVAPAPAKAPPPLANAGESGAAAGQASERAVTRAGAKAAAAEKPAPPPELGRPKEALAPAKAAEQVVSIQKPTVAAAPETKAAAPSQKTLEGYVIQLVFEHKSDAQQWAETIQRRGYAVSVTEAGGASVRLRLGNFSVREDAERQLRALKQEGLNGIILNLPHPYRPGDGAAAASEKLADTKTGGE